MNCYRYLLLTFSLMATPVWALPLPLQLDFVSASSGVVLHDAGGTQFTADDAQEAPPHALPFSAEATTVSDAGSTAFGFAGTQPDTLTTAASLALDAAGLDVAGTVTTLLTYSANFVSPGSQVQLSLLLEQVIQTLVPTFSVLTDLQFVITSGGVDLLNEAFSFSDDQLQTIVRTVELTPGATANLLLVLGTTATAGSRGQGDALASAQFELQAIPAPSTLPSFVAGLVAFSWLQRRRLLVAILALLPLAPLLWVLTQPASARPFIPEDESQVLERLPTAVAGSAQAREWRQWRADLAADPANLDLALRLAWAYLAQGRANGDPRYYGYAQATLDRWWSQPPPAVRLLRATLRQNQHDFDGALADLNELLKVQPRNAQAWLTRAVILGVQAQYPAALQSCLALTRVGSGWLAGACTGHILSLSGKADTAYPLLEKVLEQVPPDAVQDRLWLLTGLAETAARLNRSEIAAQHFQQALALGVRDVYLLTAYADFLLDRNQPARVRELLADDTRADELLLRRVLAEQRLDSPRFPALRDDLQARIAARRQRGDASHLGSDARFTLEVLKQPDAALALAVRNWAMQREPRDARILLEAALAAGQPAAAQPVLDWLAQTGGQDERLAELARRLRES